MGYLHIDNLYKAQTILMMKECYALEKIHGTSAHVAWNPEKDKITFFSGGESHVNFVKLFNEEQLKETFKLEFPDKPVVIHGEAYGGSCQRMSHTYGKNLKFIAFDVLISDSWIPVPDAEAVCTMFNIEFVDYCKVLADKESLDKERDKPSTQAIRNGCGNDKVREGIVVRPLIELTLNNGSRLICKHKADSFKETSTPREVNPEQLKVLEDAKAIAEEWVTPMRLVHVLDKLPKGLDMTKVKLIIDAMVEDVYREGKGEIVEGRSTVAAISAKTVSLFKQYLSDQVL